MEFVVPNCETSVETPDKKEDTHEEEIEKPIVKEIMKIWKEVFEIEDISIQDDFYTLGGDSIILMRLVDEIVDSVCHDMMLDPDWRNIADLIFKFIEKTIDKKSGDNYNDNYVSTQAHQGGE